MALGGPVSQDVVVTVPARLWKDWLAEGDLAGEPWSGRRFHFFLWRLPDFLPERCYIVAGGRLRGYAPVLDMEAPCRLRADRACLVRGPSAVAVTIFEQIRGFRGWRRRWWDRYDENPFPSWRELPRA